MFPDIGVVDVQNEEDTAELSSYLNSELGLEEERVVCPTSGGLADILLVILFFFTLMEHGSDVVFSLSLRVSKQALDLGVVSKESVYACSINLFSHGLAAIQRSNQLHPQLLLS